MRPDPRKAANDRVGARIGDKWRLDRLLGLGGCASVYAATHRNGAKAAVKILHEHALQDDTIRTRFIREGYVANKVGHPGVVAVLDDDTTPDGIPYLVMELLEGKSLEPQRKGEGLPIPAVLHIGEQVLDVLERAHAEGIVHRDLKPANLFVTTSGQLKVLDFGIARLVQTAASQDPSNNTQTGFVLGTSAFMSPEQARAKWSEVDGRSDLFALACTLLALMLGRRPRVAGTPAEDFLLAMTEPMPPAKTLVPELTPAVAAVLDKALAFDREDRWPDAASMREALRAASNRSERASASTLVSTAVMPDAPMLAPAAKKKSSTLPMTAEQQKAIAKAASAASEVIAKASEPPRSAPSNAPSKRPPKADNKAIGPIEIVLSILLLVALGLGSFSLVRLARRQ